MAPRRLKLEVKIAQDSAKTGQDGGLVGHRALKMAKIAPRRLKLEVKIAQDSAKRCQDRGPVAALGCSGLVGGALA